MSRAVLAAMLLLVAGAARADEGMWLPNDFPSDKVQAAYGFKPDAAWLDHARLSAIRLANGCSASLVSANGLVATNHHCVRECLTSSRARATTPRPAVSWPRARPTRSVAPRPRRTAGRNHHRHRPHPQGDGRQAGRGLRRRAQGRDRGDHPSLRWRRR
ncbi:MAG: S46 family peptidase [Aliidongia sp.]